MDARGRPWPMPGNTGGMGRHGQDGQQGMEKTQMGSSSLALAPLLSKVYQNQREFWQPKPCAMSSESWWFGTWCVVYEGKITAGKMMMFVIDDLVIPQQGKC